MQRLTGFGGRYTAFSLGMTSPSPMVRASSTSGSAETSPLSRSMAVEHAREVARAHDVVALERALAGRRAATPSKARASPWTRQGTLGSREVARSTRPDRTTSWCSVTSPTPPSARSRRRTITCGSSTATSSCCSRRVASRGPTVRTSMQTPTRSWARRRATSGPSMVTARFTDGPWEPRRAVGLRGRTPSRPSSPGRVRHATDRRGSSRDRPVERRRVDDEAGRPAPSSRGRSGHAAQGPSAVGRGSRGSARDFFSRVCRLHANGPCGGSSSWRQ